MKPLLYQNQGSYHPWTLFFRISILIPKFLTAGVRKWHLGCWVKQLSLGMPMRGVLLCWRHLFWFHFTTHASAFKAAFKRVFMTPSCPHLRSSAAWQHLKNVSFFLLIPSHFQGTTLLLVMPVDVVSVFPFFFPGCKTLSTFSLEIFMI